MSREDRRHQDRDEWFRRPIPVWEQLKSFGYCLAFWVLRVFVLLLVLFGAFAIWNVFWHDRAPADGPMAEKVADDEKYYFSEIVASTIRAELFHRDNLLKGTAPEGTSSTSAPGYNRSEFRRDVHTKSHGCVNATFAVAKDVPAQFRHGLFKTSGGPHPKAIIRFSSGQADLDPDKTAWSGLLPVPRDVRGMAVKILGVEGQKLVDDPDPDGATQDFIATTSAVFFIRTIEQYSQFSRAFSRDDLLAYFLPNWLDPRSWHLHQFWLLMKSLGPVPDSLIQETYYSGSAYRLGPTTYLKFRLRPCKPVDIDRAPVQDKADYLRLELQKRVAAGDSCFNFEVQPQMAGKNMPVEDATVEWSETDSPFQPIATITIVKQSNNTKEMNERCENLEFNPWHSTEDFRPVGVMNRLRKVIYQEMADFRRTKNCEALCSSVCPGASKACIDQCPWLKDPVPEKLFPDGCPAQPPASKPGN